MAQPCIFCQGEAKLTAEHLWSDWINALSETGIRYDFRRTDPTGKVQEWTLPKLDATAKLVCKKVCNAGWMSDLEKEAQPLLIGMIEYGSPVTLLPSGISTLAAFAFKNAAIANHCDGNEEPSFTPVARNRFRLHRTIPPGVQMWIAAFSEEFFSGAFSSYRFRPGPGPLLGSEFFVFTYHTGMLVLQVLATRWRKRARRNKNLPVIGCDQIWESATTRFWPYGSEVKGLLWPPPRWLDASSFPKFHYRWNVPILIRV